MVETFIVINFIMNIIIFFLLLSLLGKDMFFWRIERRIFTHKPYAIGLWKKLNECESIRLFQIKWRKEAGDE